MTAASPQNHRATRFAALEGWRGIACLMVLFYHCGVNLRRPPLVWFGSCGVHMFFVLSGYLLFRPYAVSIVQNRAAPSTVNFYLRRFLRIVPPYLVALACFTGLRIATGTHIPSIRNVILHALLIFNYYPSIDFFSINGVLWSLAIEAQFYLLLPVVCLMAIYLFTRRSSTAALVACVACMFVIGIVARWAELQFLGGYYARIANADGIRFRSTFAYLDLFAFGMLVAAIQVGGSSALRSLWRGRLARILIIVIGLALCLAANNWCERTTQGGWQFNEPILFGLLFPVILCAGLALLLLYLVSDQSTGPRWLSSRPLRGLGEISYSLYLYHTGVLFFVFRLGLFRHWPYHWMTFATALVALGPAIILAAIMYFAVERPSLMLVARVRDRQALPPAAIDPQAAAGDPAAAALQPVSLLAP